MLADLDRKRDDSSVTKATRSACLFRFAGLLSVGLTSACSSSTPTGPYAEAGAPEASAPDAGGACPAPSSPVQGLSNNSAELDGPAFGEGTAPNDTLRKVIRADL